MTTAFASLTDGTPILQVRNALSYVCYFIFVWWIWVAQVAYNMRFRQADWVHRLMVFAQLIVFSALAAFTHDFDITSGLTKDTETAEADDIFTQLGLDQSGVSAFNFRDNRLPRLNARGVSMTMGISRIILLVQYVIVFYHARHFPRTSLIAHILPLVFSTLCYFAVFALLGKTEDSETGLSKGVEIIKILLWYIPIVIEMASHFVALKLPGFVGYSVEAVHARSGTVFLIILGAGLDKITSGFQAIVGNTGLGANGIPLFGSAALIFIGYFSLYFGTPGSTRELGHKRALSWLFSQFFFLAALIVTLQGVATSLRFNNLYAAMVRNSNAIAPVYQWIDSNPRMNVTATDFNSSAQLFDKLGVPFTDIVDDLNTYITLAIQQNNSALVPAGELFEEMSLYDNILSIFEAQPEDGSLLSAKLQYFLNDPSNTTVVNLANFEDLYSSIIKDRGSSALWFYPAAGATILALVLMCLIKGLPRDKWEWAVIGSRFIIGSGVCGLGVLDIGASKPVFDDFGNRTDSKIWVLVVGNDHLLLIIMAITMAVSLIIENLIAYAANRSYSSFNDVNFLEGPERRRSRRQQEYKQQTQANDVIPLTPFNYDEPQENAPIYTDTYNPYHGVGSEENALYSRAGGR